METDIYACNGTRVDINADFTDMITYHSYNKNVFIKACVEGTKCVRVTFSLCPGISTVHKQRLCSYTKIALAVQSLTQSHYKTKGGTVQLIAIKLGKKYCLSDSCDL